MQADAKNLLYLYDLPKDSTTSQKIAQIIKDLTGYELGASNPPQIRRDPNKHFYSAFVKITDPSKFNEVADKMRTFEIEGKCCRALPFDRSFLGANRSALKDFSIFVKFDRDVKEGQVQSHGDLYNFIEKDFNTPAHLIKSAKLSINADHSSRGYGFVTFNDPQIAREATNKKTNKVFQIAPFQQKDRTRKAFNNIYVKNFPESWTEAKVKEIFGKYGPIKSVAIKKVKLPGSETETPFAFVCFEDQQNKDVGVTAAHTAIQDLNGKEFEGNQLYVKEALKKEAREQEKQKEQLRFKQSKKRCNLYVKNFPQNTTRDQLMELFQRFGAVESLKMLPKEEEALYAFVCYASPDMAANAKAQLNATTFNGKQLYVNHYELKEVRKLQQEEIRDKADYQNAMKQNSQQITMELLNKPEIFQLIQFLINQIQRQQAPRGMGFRGQRPQGQPRMNNQGGLGKSFSQPGPVPQPLVQQMPPQPVAMVPPTGMPPMGIPPNLPPQIVEYIMKGRQIIPGVVPQNPNYKNIVGEFIYEYVEQISGEEKAPKITGMLIDLQIPEIHGYLSDFGRLQQKIQEANVLLNSQQ